MTTFAADLRGMMDDWDAATPAQQAQAAADWARRAEAMTARLVARAATEDAIAILRAARGRAWDDTTAPLVDLDTADGTVCRALRHLRRSLTTLAR